MEKEFEDFCYCFWKQTTKIKDIIRIIDYSLLHFLTQKRSLGAMVARWFSVREHFYTKGCGFGKLVPLYMTEFEVSC